MAQVHEVFHAEVAARDRRRSKLTWTAKVFDAVVTELAACEDVMILNAFRAPPATSAELARAEKTLGQPLPADVRAFYRICNGLSLVWVDRQHPQFKPTLKRKDGVLTKPHPFARVAGHVAIQPIDRVVASITAPLTSWTALDAPRPSRKQLAAATGQFDVIDGLRGAFLVVTNEGIEFSVPEDRAFDGSVRTDLSTYLATVFALGGARVRDRAFIGSPRDARFDFEHLGASKLDLDRVLSMVRQDVHYHASDVEYRFSEEALQLFEAGDYAGAAKVCAELIAIDPLLARAGWLRVQCLAKLGKKAAAEQAARTVPVSAVGGLAELYDGAVITWKAGATEIAKRAIVSALASWPDDGDSWYLFGELLKSEPVRALPCFERAKELGVEDPDLDAAIVAAKARLAPKSRKHKG